ncbi:leucine-rich repeat and coiled-coil domain-containing protein 1-like [Carassius carassius]|uniref:leucine-rich repeat and coiled-coil domain-containing protein 1-like n=1 Tax=Carassius carassius TaxID=217509 RepID=UPI0028688A11|nr:leucine-rich repeat and coiled-coil domain-containing protein 1-like [Carassius carassius]
MRQVMAVRELCLTYKDISSLLEVPLDPSISSLNLHFNRLTKIECPGEEEELVSRLDQAGGVCGPGQVLLNGGSYEPEAEDTFNNHPVNVDEVMRASFLLPEVHNELLCLAGVVEQVVVSASCGQVLLEQDEQIHKLLDENVQDKRKLKQQLEEEMASEKAELLNRLESQVKRMKEGFDSKEIMLIEERVKASQAHGAAMEKLHSVDDAFHRQLESLQASHQTEIPSLANDKQKQIEKANKKVLLVEEEMCQLLEEAESNKRVMEEKIRCLTQVLKDFLPITNRRQKRGNALFKTYDTYVSM